MLRAMETAGDGKCVQFIFKPQKATLYYTIKAILHHFYIISVLTSLPPEHQRANGFPTILATSGTHGCWLPHHPNNQGSEGCWLPQPRDTWLFGYSPSQHPGTHSCLVSPPHTTEVTRREPYVDKMLSSQVLVGVQWETNKQESLKLMNP